MPSPDKTTTPRRSSELTVWTGWDPRRRDGGHSAEIDQEQGHLTSIDTEATENYALLAVVARGFRPPQYLQRRELRETEADAPTDTATPESIPGVGDLRLIWSVRYRRISTTDSGATAKPYAIYLLGVNPPPDASSEDLEVFNDFYTNVHLPEVAERRNAIYAERFELVDEQRPPTRALRAFLLPMPSTKQAPQTGDTWGLPIRRAPKSGSSTRPHGDFGTDC